MKYRTSSVSRLKCVALIDLVLAPCILVRMEAEWPVPPHHTTVQSLVVMVKFCSGLLSLELIRDLSEREELLSNTVIDH